MNMPKYSAERSLRSQLEAYPTKVQRVAAMDSAIIPQADAAECIAGLVGAAAACALAPATIIGGVACAAAVGLALNNCPDVEPGPGPFMGRRMPI